MQSKYSFPCKRKQTLDAPFHEAEQEETERQAKKYQRRVDKYTEGEQK